MIMADDKNLPIRLLGRNDAGPGNPGAYRTSPKLADSQIFPGMRSVQPEEEGVFQSRTGRTDRGITSA